MYNILNCRAVKLLSSAVLVSCLITSTYTSHAHAQDALPRDNGLFDYHTEPDYRESESHPLRVLAYVVHPVGWILRETITRPLSYFASSSAARRSVLGYRYPFDYRNTACFNADGAIPDCRKIPPYLNSSSIPAEDSSEFQVPKVFFPNVNFDFDKRGLNTLGKGVVKRIASVLASESGLHVVLQGHTDYIGSNDYNDTLGMDRAKAVLKELKMLGISESRLSTVSFGETQPVIDEQTDAARAINRRVEVHPDGSK